MHRKFLQDKFDQYLPMDENEALTLLDMVEFVNQYPNCFDRELSIGHITGSAWVVDLDRSHVLLTHHRKLDRWLQLGGHSDGDPNTLEVALREGREESGIEEISPVTEEVFDIDIHLIPARKNEPEHYHYDVRFLIEADRNTPFVVSEESHDLAWVPLDEVEKLIDEASILRMLKKTYEIK
ncbi:MAG: NUDIX hydrolase [Gammaproteobacteria bacterium]|nr:NUDIX hydrolase [Gammaproteobacteria bacterium]